MTHASSAATMKGRRNYAFAQQKPRENTITRSVYDRLMENRGREVSLTDLTTSTTNPNEIVAHLQITYDLDIRARIIYKGRGKGRGRGREKDCGRYCLVGEWFGKHYVDYLAEVLRSEGLLNEREAKP